MSYFIQKSKDTFRSEFYLDCVRGFACIACRLLHQKQRGPTQPHHTEGRGTAAGSDGKTVPVCQTHHLQSPKQCNEQLEHLTGLPIGELVAMTERQFCQEHGYEIPRDGATLEEVLVRAELGEFRTIDKRVTNGNSKSKGRKLPGSRPLTKQCGTPDQPLTD